MDTGCNRIGLCGAVVPIASLCTSATESMMRVRFAPSPTGKVHIGNIRTAIFNWLAARSQGGEFQLRIEDTDRQRSTSEATEALFDVLAWMGLDYDAEPVYQSKQLPGHLAAAERLLAQGNAYRFAKGDGGEAILLRFPWDCSGLPFVREGDRVVLDLHPDEAVTVDETGVSYALKTRKGKAAPQQGTLAGFRGLQLLAADGRVLFEIGDDVTCFYGGESRIIEDAVRMSFLRREVFFTDLVKGELSKPLDSMRDQVIVRSDGAPVFHLANVCDDIEMEITHVMRGDDHVENTYRHVFLYAALGAELPRFGHFPMIVNKQGKPYSKRDGDAYVGDFRAKGYQPDALFNYLALLGWSPGNDVEYMTRDEMVSSFSIERILSSPAQMDFRKLLDFNGRFIASLAFDEFREAAWGAAAGAGWRDGCSEEAFSRVARLLQSRTKLLSDVETWAPFFVDTPEYDEAAVQKVLVKPGVAEALQAVCNAWRELPGFTAAVLEQSLHDVTEERELKRGKLNQPVRVALTGQTSGAGLFETAELLGKDRVLRRLQDCVARATLG